MKSFVGLAICLFGIFLGLYLGIYWGFIGGIAAMIEAYKNNIDAMGIALGFARFSFASLIGFGSFWLCMIIGGAIAGMNWKITVRPRSDKEK